MLPLELKSEGTGFWRSEGNPFSRSRCLHNMVPGAFILRLDREATQCECLKVPPADLVAGERSSAAWVPILDMLVSGWRTTLGLVDW